MFNFSKISAGELEFLLPNSHGDISKKLKKPILWVSSWMPKKEGGPLPHLQVSQLPFLCSIPFFSPMQGTKLTLTGQEM